MNILLIPFFCLTLDQTVDFFFTPDKYEGCFKTASPLPAKQLEPQFAIEGIGKVWSVQLPDGRVVFAVGPAREDLKDVY